MPTIETSDNSFTPVILIVGSAFEILCNSIPVTGKKVPGGGVEEDEVAVT
jgi:hypothetical protein